MNLDSLRWNEHNLHGNDVYTLDMGRSYGWNINSPWQLLPLLSGQDVIIDKSKNVCRKHFVYENHILTMKDVLDSSAFMLMRRIWKSSSSMVYECIIRCRNYDSPLARSDNYSWVLCNKNQ